MFLDMKVKPDTVDFIVNTWFRNVDKRLLAVSKSSYI